MGNIGEEELEKVELEPFPQEMPLVEPAPVAKPVPAAEPVPA